MDRECVIMGNNAEGVLPQASAEAEHEHDQRVAQTRSQTEVEPELAAEIATTRPRAVDEPRKTPRADGGGREKTVRSFKQLYPAGHPIKDGAVPFSFPHVGWAAKQDDSVVLDVSAAPREKIRQLYASEVGPADSTRQDGLYMVLHDRRHKHVRPPAVRACAFAL